MKTKYLPTYSRPKAVIFLDDDVQFLEAMGSAMPANWCVYLHSRPNEYADHLKTAQQHWAADIEAHHQMMQSWWGGQSLPNLLINYWTNNPNRFALPSLSFVDYAMPGTTGLEVLRRTNASIGSRVLLTGIADASVAIQAFNDDLIEQYIVKQTPNLAKEIISTVADFSNEPQDFYQGIWRSALSSAQISTIESTDVANLQSLITSHAIVEYALIPQPFGILGLDKHAKAHWIQLEASDNNNAAVELAIAAEMEKEDIQAIQQSLAVCNAEILLSLNCNRKPHIESLAKIPNSDLFYAHFELTHLGQVGASHVEFLRALPPRNSDQFQSTQPRSLLSAEVAH